MKPGETISWRTVNGTSSGVVVDEQGDWHLVILDDGEYVVVDSKSIIYEAQHQPE